MTSLATPAKRFVGPLPAGRWRSAVAVLQRRPA